MFRTTIRVFEYERLVVGQVLTVAEGGETRFSVRQFDALARFAESSADSVLELGHRSVRFTNYVGYLQVGDLGIEVLPKGDRHGPRDVNPWHDALLDMIGVAYGLRLLHPATADLDLRRANLLEVYVARFLDQVEALLHQGLVRGYRKVRENRTAFRGRLLVAQNIRANLVQAQRMFVEHQVYDHDTLVNQTLQAALGVLEQSNLQGGLRNRLLRVRGAFPEAVREHADVRALDRLVPTRNTERYADALEMARLILDHQTPNLRAGGSRVLALLFDMNVLWERYVATLLRRVAPDGVRVVAQDARRFWKRHGHRAKTVKPDIVVVDERDGGARVVLDTKWKVPRNGQPSDNDLKQMFVYNELYDCDRSLLVYPAAPDRIDADGTFEPAGHICGTRYVSLFDAGRYSRSTAQAQISALVDIGLGSKQ